VIDSSVASATGLFNIHTLQWDDEVLQYIGISSGKLSQVVPATHAIVYAGTNNRLLLQQGVQFIVGASDGALANVGSGATQPHMMAVSIGTSNAARVIINKPATDEQMRTFCYHVKSDQYIAGGTSNNGAIVMQWLKESILNTKDSYETLFDDAAAVAPGSDGLLLLPYILGERAPIWNANAKGVFMGLSIQHTHAHLVRAAMEGVANISYSIGKILMEKSTITEIHASGGFTKTPLWVQMLADLYNCKIIVTENGESAALGAAIVGAEALSLPFDVKQEGTEVYMPDDAQHETALQRFQAFERLYALLKNEFSPTLPPSII
jgi:gluconokinase